MKENYLLSGKLEETNDAYGIAKIAGIKLCDALRKQHNFDAISLMPTNLYGPGDNYHPKTSHVMASLIRKFYINKVDIKNEKVDDQEFDNEDYFQQIRFDYGKDIEKFKFLE